MLGGCEDEVGVVGVVDHHGPHFGFGDCVGEVGVFFDFDFAGDVPRVKKV